jgi:hypothetical protein
MEPPAISDHRYSREVLHPPMESKAEVAHSAAQPRALDAEAER